MAECVLFLYFRYRTFEGILTSVMCYVLLYRLMIVKYSYLSHDASIRNYLTYEYRYL